MAASRAEAAASSARAASSWTSTPAQFLGLQQLARLGELLPQGGDLRGQQLLVVLARRVVLALLGELRLEGGHLGLQIRYLLLQGLALRFGERGCVIALVASASGGERQGHHGQAQRPA